MITKKRWFALPLALAVMFACKKNSSTPNYPEGIFAKINGVSETFDGATAGAPSTNNLAIAGDQKVATSPDVIEMYLTTNGPITTGTYTANPTAADYHGFEITFVQGSTSLAYDNLYMTGEANNVTLTITSLTATTAQGTFSGTLKLVTGETGPATLNITDGTFNVKLP